MHFWHWCDSFTFLPEVATSFIFLKSVPCTPVSVLTFHIQEWGFKILSKEAAFLVRIFHVFKKNAQARIHLTSISIYQRIQWRCMWSAIYTLPQKKHNFSEVAFLLGKTMEECKWSHEEISNTSSYTHRQSSCLFLFKRYLEWISSEALTR